MAATRPRASRKERIFSRREVEGLIAEGRTVFILDGKVLKVDPWLKYHPGGDKAIMHMVGRDAADEVNAYAFSHVALNGAPTDLVPDYIPPKHSIRCEHIRLEA